MKKLLSEKEMTKFLVEELNIKDSERVKNFVLLALRLRLDDEDLLRKLVKKNEKVSNADLYLERLYVDDGTSGEWYIKSLYLYY